MRVRWIVRGDIDGFFGLALDNLVQLLLIDTLCRTVLGFPPELLYGRVLPAAAISILIGNVAYAFQARALAARTGRTDVCALPYGINTVSLFAHVFLVMLPAKALAERAGAVDPVRVAWQAGLLATFATGVIELGCAFVAERVRKATPRAALLSTLAGIALGFISLGFLFRTFAHPVVGLTTLAIVMLTYFGRVRFKGHLPGGVVAVTLGTLLCWTTGIAPVGARPSPAAIHAPVPVVGDLIAAIGGGHMLPYLSVIIAMGLFNVLGSLQNIESAEAAGDSYDTRYSLTVNGIGSIAAAFFGSAFPTTIYIGHPGWKAMGARAGLFDPERRIRDDDLRHRYAGLDRVGDPHRGRDGNRPLDRHDDRRTGISGNAARACARRSGRPPARDRRVGRAHGEERAARRRARWAGGAIYRIAGRRVPENRYVDCRRFRDRAGIPLHRDGALRGGGRRDRAALAASGGVVGVRRFALGLRADALLPVDVW